MSAIDDLNQTLQRAFLFQPSDLEANNRRELSRRQMALMRGSTRLVMFGTLIFGFVMLAGMPLLFVALNSPGSGSTTTQALVTGLIVGLIGFALGGGSIAYYFLRGNDQRKARITMTQGAAQPANGGEYEYKVRIGSTVLRVGLSSQAGAFTPGASYRVYHVKQGMLNSVLSAEVLAQPVPASSEQFIALNASQLNKPDPEAERGTNSGLVRAGMAIFIAIALLVIAIPLALVLTASLPPLVQGVVYVLVFVVAIGFPFAAIGLLGRAAPEAAPQLAEVRELTKEMVADKLDDME